MFVQLLLYHLQWTLRRDEGRRKGVHRRKQLHHSHVGNNCYQILYFILFYWSLPMVQTFKHALNHKWSVCNHLPTKLFLYEQKLLGSAVTWVPKSILAHFRMGPSSGSCALLSLGQMGATTGICRSRTGFSGNPQKGPGGPAWKELMSATGRRDRDMVLQRDRPWFPPYPPKLQKVFCLSLLYVLLYRDIFFYITTLKILILNIL